MRKALITACLLLLVGAAVAEDPGYCHWDEKQSWQLDTAGNWVPIQIGNPGARARCWMEVINYKDSCNKRLWPLTLKHEASVAQWIILGINGDGFHWGVRKPGYYSSDCIWLWFRSNYDVVVDFSGFENLLSLYPDSCIDDTIEVMYALIDDSLAPPPIGDSAWMTVDQLNEIVYRVYDSYELHYQGWRKKIWCYIHVSPCNTACEYVDPDWATITLTLQRIKPWIDPETGLFARMPDFPFQ